MFLICMFVKMAINRDRYSRKLMKLKLQRPLMFKAQGCTLALCVLGSYISVKCPRVRHLNYNRLKSLSFLLLLPYYHTLLLVGGYQMM